MVSAVGQKSADNSVRLYMVPGMQHCGGGPGATFFGQLELGTSGDAQHDIFTALVQWVEDGKAPQSLVAKKVSDGKVEMTRPICPYPLSVKYNGTGDPDVAASFQCAAGK